MGNGGPYSLTYLFTYLLLLEKLTGFQLVKKFPAIYGTRRFITAFTSARHLSLSWALCEYFVTRYFFFYGEDLLAPRPTPKLEDHPLSAVRDCLFNIYWWTFLHPKPEGAPCRGDRDPLTTGYYGKALQIFSTLDKGEWLAPRPGRLTPGERTHGTDRTVDWVDPRTGVRRVGSQPPLYGGNKSIAPTGNRTKTLGCRLATRQHTDCTFPVANYRNKSSVSKHHSNCGCNR